MNEPTEYLRKLGLNLYQARAMVVLLSKQYATAKEICDYGELPHTKVYQVLRSLADQKLVDSAPGKPRVYQVESASKALNQLIRVHEKRVNTLKEQKMPQLKVIRSLELTVNMPSVSMHPVLAAQIPS